MNTIIQNATRSGVFNRTQKLIGALTVCVGVATAFQASASFSLGDAANYAVLFEGGGGNTLNINNGPGLNGLAVDGNIGIGGTGKLQLSGPLTINGNIDFAGPVDYNGPYSGDIHVTGSINPNVATVQNALDTVNLLSYTLGLETGTALTVNLNNNDSQTINASSGTLDGNGNRIFTVSSFNFGGGSTLTISGSASDFVVFNFSANTQFKGTILLTGGLTSDQVLFNIIGGANLTGGHTLSINNNGDILTGTFLDPNGTISMDHSVLNGRLFGGDTHNEQIVSGSLVNAPLPAVPEPTTFIAGALLLLPFGASTLRILRRKATA
jgi:hypothetical protein